MEILTDGQKEKFKTFLKKMEQKIHPSKWGRPPRNRGAHPEQDSPPPR
jgi:hypothetical protein